MTLAIIVAHDPDLTIGNEGGLPWHYPKDLKYFKKTTMGHPLLMGRKVFQELDEKPLPGRKNVVLSKSRVYPHVPTFPSIDEALKALAKENHEIVYIIGGGEIYRQTIDRADKLFVTEIHDKYDGDTRFPEYRDKIGSLWKEIKREDHTDISFVVYERMEQ